MCSVERRPTHDHLRTCSVRARDSGAGCLRLGHRSCNLVANVHTRTCAPTQVGMDIRNGLPGSPFACQLNIVCCEISKLGFGVSAFVVGMHRYADSQGLTLDHSTVVCTIATGLHHGFVQALPPSVEQKSKKKKHKLHSSKYEVRSSSECARGVGPVWLCVCVCLCMCASAFARVRVRVCFFALVAQPSCTTLPFRITISTVLTGCAWMGANCFHFARALVAWPSLYHSLRGCGCVWCAVQRRCLPCATLHAALRCARSAEVWTRGTCKGALVCSCMRALLCLCLCELRCTAVKNCSCAVLLAILLF